MATNSRLCNKTQKDFLKKGGKNFVVSEKNVFLPPRKGYRLNLTELSKLREITNI
jgi:hypothetical protein